MDAAKTLSVVIPTHNRAELLNRVLIALGHQTHPADDFEVIVVADACEDDTKDVVKAHAEAPSYDLHYLEHSARSAAASRNLGVSRSVGRYLLFLDDDVVPEEGMVDAHLEAGEPGTVVLGYSKPIFPAEKSWWQAQARLWWEDAFREMARPEHRFTYRDFFSGNVSLPAELFNALGGFDLAIDGRLEDYELGIRLLESGATFKFVYEAVGLHYENTNFDTWLRRQHSEGMANVHMGYRHPPLRRALFAEYLTEYPYWYDRAIRGLRSLSFRNTHLNTWLCGPLMRVVHLSEKLVLRGPYWYATRALRELVYWSGVAEFFKSEEEFCRYLQEGPDPIQIDKDKVPVDLALVVREDELDQVLRAASRDGVVIYYDGIKVTTIPPGFGAELLTARHLFGMLRELAQRKFFPWPAFQAYLFSLAEDC